MVLSAAVSPLTGANIVLSAGINSRKLDGIDTTANIVSLKPSKLTKFSSAAQRTSHQTSVCRNSTPFFGQQLAVGQHSQRTLKKAQVSHVRAAVATKAPAMATTNVELEGGNRLEQGDELILNIQIADNKYQAVEFTLKDEASNTWYKNKDANFKIEIPESRAKIDPSTIVLPEELVQVQAYLRWERNGKQSYSPEKEKEEYEKGRSELQNEVANGTSVGELRNRLLGGGSSSDSPPPSPPPAAERAPEPEAPNVPEDLVSVQSYIRWERNGKQNYSPEQQQSEYEEARRELQNEVKNGTSVEDLRKRLTGGSQATAPAPPPPAKSYTSDRIQRKQRDHSELISKFGPGKEGDAPQAQAAPKEPTPLELGASVMEGADKGAVISRKFYKFGEDQLLVLVTNPDGDVKLRIASSIKEPLHLVWGVAKGRNQAWENSKETSFTKGFAGDETLQSLELDLTEEAKTYTGVPFVIKGGSDNYYKDNGSDFYAGLKAIKVKDAGDGSGTAKALLDEIVDQESEAERSLMHRFNIGAGIVESAKGLGELGMAAVLVWYRYMATRQLTWNKNYNVKPREISAAQDRLTDNLKAVYLEQPHLRELVRATLMTVGRGGEGDVGQRIRDEILVIQRNNDCKGGMMEEWHQKLHNNTSPDDVVICQALLDYIRADFSIDVYWKTLNDNGVSRERLASYDRPIVSEPKLRANQKDGLLRDLGEYMKSLKAVHSGADLESAVAKCMGYTQGAQDFMKHVEIHPIGGLSNDLPGLLQFVLEHVEDKHVTALVEGLLEARRELRPSVLAPHDRLKDIIFLDLALDSTLRTALERGMEHLADASPEEIVHMVELTVENLCLSSDNNEELVYCLKEGWALRAKAVMDRTRLALADKAEHLQTILQPSAEYMGARLNVDQWAIDIFTEEIIRAGSAASLSLLLNRLDPVLRKAADMGSWQVISPVAARGFVEVVAELGEVQDKVYTRPTILVAGRVRGEEEIPDGAVALLTPDMPDVLSHVSVRARNGKICFGTCFDPKILEDLRAKNGKPLLVEPAANSELRYSEISEAEVSGEGASAASAEVDAPPPGISITKKSFAGKFAVAADDFNNDLVGAKSRNIAGLRGKLPGWVKLPTSAALPFGSFEQVCSEAINKDVAAEIQRLNKEVTAGDFDKLPEVRKAVLGLKAPPKLVEELTAVMKSSGMPCPTDEGEARWEQAWTAIKRVWASKWNERAFFSMRKAKLDHADLCMAVLVQEIVQADYAFVIHTTNPSTEDASEIYAEVVKGLGETLVGAYSGRALSFVAKKTQLDGPEVKGYPSKRLGLFIRRSIIFRSDSNGEDLEGYAGAGLYDSVPMDLEEEVVVDYSTDPLLTDLSFQKDVLTKIAKAGAAIEEALGSAQDIEGVVKDGELYVVQTRPQM
eukprot:jgi/Mesen1/1064/ME000123S00237